MTRTIVEMTFSEPLAEDEVHAVEERMRPCLDLYGARWVGSYWSQDHRRMICEYEATEVASLHRVQREAEVHFDDAWTAEVLGAQ